MGGLEQFGAFLLAGSLLAMFCLGIWAVAAIVVLLVRQRIERNAIERRLEEIPHGDWPLVPNAIQPRGE